MKTLRLDIYNFAITEDKACSMKANLVLVGEEDG